MGLVTVNTSGKGGAGKSTVSVGLGCTLAKNGKRVLLIDGDAGLRSLDAMPVSYTHLDVYKRQHWKSSAILLTQKK